VRFLTGILRSIDDYAFAHNSIKLVYIPQSCSAVGKGAFEDNKLTRVSLPPSIRSIGERAFAQNLITAVNVPEYIKTIGEEAFADNIITRITISKNRVFPKSAFGKYGESFYDFYEKNLRKAGRYTYTNESWKK
jgi:hypothetical protein